MPKQLIARMKSGYSGSGLSAEEISHRIYGALNNMGAMHGSKETAKGASYEAKFQRDHGGSDGSVELDSGIGSPAEKVLKRARSQARAQKFINKSRQPKGF